MLKNIVEFLDNNPFIGIILILFIICLIFKNNKQNTQILNQEENKAGDSASPHIVEKTSSHDAMSYPESEQIEGMSNIEAFSGYTNFSSNIFSKNFASTDMSKTVNLKCKINDIEYYLANMDINPELTTRNTNKLQKDCSTSSLILVPVAEVNANLATYLKSLSTAKKLCAYTFKTTCLDNLKNPTPEEESKCDTIPSSCNYNRNFTHDFTVKELPSKDGDCGPKKYLFFGVRSVPQPGSSAPYSMINHELYYSANPYPIPIVCGDYYPYGAKGQQNEWGEIYVSEISEPETAIIGVRSGITVKLAFKTQIVLPGKDANGNDMYTPCPSCDPNYKYSYIGYCKDSDNLDYKTADGKSYKRICVVPSNLISTQDGVRILDFEPVIVNN